MSVECQVNVNSQSELDIGGRETCLILKEAKHKENSKKFNSYIYLDLVLPCFDQNWPLEI